MALTVETVRAFRAALSDPAAAGDADEALLLIRELEEAKNAATATQATLSVLVHDAQTAADRARGIHADETARVVGSQLGLARRISPRLGSRFLGVARAVAEMPHTGAALRAGVIGEWQATQLVAQTAFLSLDDRQRVDESVKELLGKVSDRRLTAATQAAAYRADPEAFTARRAKAESERRVSLRPAPDCMTLLTALLPVADGVACYAALNRAGQIPTSPDDTRGKGARTADTLVERITGRPARLATAAAITPQHDATSADPGKQPSGPDSGQQKFPSPVAVNLLVPMEALTGDAEGHLDGFGSIPADLVREFLSEHETAGGLIRRVSRCRRADNSWRWTHAPEHSRACWPHSCGCATKCAGRHSAERLSSTSITSNQLLRAARRLCTTPAVIASVATTRRNIPICG